jgi:hypothetical protein
MEPGVEREIHARLSGSWMTSYGRLGTPDSQNGGEVCVQDLVHDGGASPTAIPAHARRHFTLPPWGAK